MDKGNQSRLKLRISRIFRSSFNACKPRNLSDVIDRPVFWTQTRQRYHLANLFSPKPQKHPFPSICRPRCSEKPDSDPFPRRKVSNRSSLLAPATGKCSLTTPSKPLYAKPRSSRSRKKKKNPTHMMQKGSFESCHNYYDIFSSDDNDDDETTLFSSKSLSSDSSDSFRLKNARRRRKTAARRNAEVGLTSEESRVKESFAVVKKSSDPYSDFRASMVEMIVEQQIFGARDLENLLQTFLSLNSHHHHRVIIEVFMEIWEALFTNRG